MPALPSGTVPFLFTDIEGSTALWERDPTVMQKALATHHAILQQAIESHRGAVVIMQSLIERLTGRQEDSSIIIVLSTLAIAISFRPFLNRIQNFVDRRFYHNKYQVERVLRDFAQIARDEVDLQVLTRSLVSVVYTTIQPAMVTPWLKRDEFAPGYQ